MPFISPCFTLDTVEHLSVECTDAAKKQGDGGRSVELKVQQKGGDQFVEKRG